MIKLPQEVSEELFIELIIRFSLESLALLLILITVYRSGFFPRSFNLSSKQSVAVVVLFGLWTIVQCADRLQYHYPQALSFFPMARFAMYQIAPTDKRIITYKFRDEKGEQVSLASTFSAIGLPSVDSKMKYINKLLLSKSIDKKAKGMKELRNYCRGLARAHYRDTSKTERLQFEILEYIKPEAGEAWAKETLFSTQCS